MDLFGWKKRCRQLEAENRRLKERNAWLEKRLFEVDQKNTQLAQSLVAAKKNSTNSSKPPSTDIVKPQPEKRGKRSKRRIGAQKAHPKHERPPFTPDQIDRQVPHRLQRCPVDPAHHIVPAEARKRTLQQVELVKDPFKVIEQVAYGIWCEDCMGKPIFSSSPHQESSRPTTWRNVPCVLW